MKKKGSITVFLSMLLGVLLLLISESLLSVRIAADRTRILCAADIGLYSLFGNYDRGLLERFGLLLLNAGKNGRMELGCVYRAFTSYMDPVLAESGGSVVRETGGFTGILLATDEEGEPFYLQALEAVRAEEEAGQETGQRPLPEEGQLQELLRCGEELYRSEVPLRYADLLEMRRNRQEELTDSPGDAPVLQPGAEERAFLTLASSVSSWQRTDLASLFPPEGKEDWKELLSEREPEKGMGLYDMAEPDESGEGKRLFCSYLLKRLDSRMTENRAGFQLEYLLEGRRGDAQNAGAFLRRLLYIRLAVNAAAYERDPALQERVQRAVRACFFEEEQETGIPEDMLRFSLIYAQSLRDLAVLVSGGGAGASRAGNICAGELLEGRILTAADPGEGVTYLDYLEAFLRAEAKETLLVRGMDMVEQKERTVRPGFRLDCCIAALEVRAVCSAEQMTDFAVTKRYCYE